MIIVDENMLKGFFYDFVYYSHDCVNVLFIS